MSDALGDRQPNVPFADRPATPVPHDGVPWLDDSLEPTDDAPTVISRMNPSPTAARNDESLLGSLRGRHLAHFELIEPIGVGGMAAVLRSRDTQLDRMVALKILPPEMAVDPENVRRFHQEARSAARLDHENIARVFFCGEDQRLHFIAFEFVEGDNLRTLLEKRGRLPVGEAVHYVLQVAAGLAHAARRGVVHRDIKPSNIIIAPNGRAKLVDMGLARSLEPQHDMGLTQSGVTLGTFDYISPEQALEPRDADVRSDIYSLGCTFYHLLTGQPPVPEGTAAKKLHHHQHVKPTDPRQLVPDLPDEAVVILDRMMAKLAKDRYQTPEHLVHHLYLAARKLGTAPEAPEGVLSLEAALPSPPAARPFVLAALAAIAVVGLIFFADTTSSPKPDIPAIPAVELTKTDTNRNPSAVPAQKATRTPGDENKTKPVSPLRTQTNVPTFRVENPTVALLADFLQQNKQAREIVLELDDLDLRTRDPNAPDLTISNPVVTIRPLHLGKRPTIRDDYRDRYAQTFQASLIIQSQTCTVENVRFVLNQTGANVPMSMLWFRGAKQQVSVAGCEFIQVNPSGEKSRMASLFFESSDAAQLELRDSCFLGFASLATLASAGKEEMVFSGASSGGQDAVLRRGPVRLDVSNCVFGPHAATFRLEGAAAEPDGQVRLNHCSIQTAAQSAVYDVAEGADAQIDARFSLFSHPNESPITGMVEGKGAVLLRRAAGRGQVTFQGQENRYHQLDSFLIVTDATEEATQRMLAEMRKHDELVELETSPWKDPHPFKRLEILAIIPAFEVDPSLPEMRLADSLKKNGRLVGAERVLSFSYLRNLPLLKEPLAGPLSRELIVTTGGKSDLGKRTYPSLQHALLDAQPGDTIRLKMDGEIKLERLVLQKPALADLTIRADPGFHPILTLSGTEEVYAPALFDLYNGKLRVEGLEIRLPARNEDTDWRAVVSFLGDGECVFKSCLFTLERSGRKTALAVFPDKRMAKTTQSPRLTLEKCFVRGQGDLVWMQGGHAADVALDNCLIALTGSLLNVESERDKESQQPTDPLVLRLRKVTSYLGENLIRLRAAKDIRNLARTRCEPVDCLFLPVGDRALVRLEGPEDEERGLRDKFSWESGGKNAYGGFTTMLEQQSIGVMMKMPPPSNLETWKKDVSGETNSEYNVKLSRPLASDASLGVLLPSVFRPTDGGKSYGVDLSALGTLPSLKARPESVDTNEESPDVDGDEP